MAEEIKPYWGGWTEKGELLHLGFKTIVVEVAPEGEEAT